MKGGVKDTRLEAKETKKIRGQGWECSRPRTKDTMQKCSPKNKINGLCTRFLRNAGDLKKKIFAHKFATFPQNSIVKIFFLQVLWRVPRRNNIAHNLGPFSTCHKIVLSSSRGQDIFEDLQGSRRRTSNCVLEDVLEAKDSTSS